MPIFTFRRALALLGFVLLTVRAGAQTPLSWASVQRSQSSGPSVNGVNPSSYGNRLAVAADGSQYVCGLFVETLTQGSSSLTTGPGQGHVFLTKYSAAGVVLWARQVESPHPLTAKLAVDAAGNAYLAGYFANSVTVGDTTLTVPTSYNSYLVKYDAQGTPQWARQGEGPRTIVENIATDASGNICLVGTFQAVANFGPTYLSGTGAFFYKLSPAGTVVQARQWGRDCTPHALALDAAGNVYVTGEFRGTATVGTTRLTSAGRNDLFLARLDPAGRPAWAQRDGGPLEDAAVAIALDAGGTPVVCGYYDWQGGPGSNIYLARFSPQGVPLWVRRPTGSGPQFLGAESVVYDGRGGYFVTGGFWDAVAFGSVTLVSAAAMQLYVARYDSQGTAVWVGTANGYSRGDALAADAAGNIFVTGALGFDVTFGTLPLTTGTLDCYVAKLTAGSVLTATRPGATPGLSLVAYPNPARGTATVLLPAGGGQLELLDALGRVVRRQVLPAAAGPCPVPVAGLAPGRYLLRATLGTGQPARTTLLVE